MKKLSDYDPILEFNTSAYFNPTLRSIIFWMCYTAIHVGLFAFGWIKQRNDPSLDVLNEIGTSIYISRGAGLVLAFDCAILM
jgi:NADPH oxidase